MYGLEPSRVDISALFGGKEAFTGTRLSYFTRRIDSRHLFVVQAHLAQLSQIGKLGAYLVQTDGFYLDRSFRGPEDDSLFGSMFYFDVFGF
jgi:hypothetical protein